LEHALRALRDLARRGTDVEQRIVRTHHASALLRARIKEVVAKHWK
jgi:hypothetical protein